jgi:hypothetical protein
MYELNMFLTFFAVAVLSAVVFVRENASALDALANWAAARSWGLKCAKVEYENRVKQQEAHAG